jgi:hypothetical protein
MLGVKSWRDTASLVPPRMQKARGFPINREVTYLRIFSRMNQVRGEGWPDETEIKRPAG